MMGYGGRDEYGPYSCPFSQHSVHANGSQVLAELRYNSFFYTKMLPVTPFAYVLLRECDDAELLAFDFICYCVNGTADLFCSFMAIAEFHQSIFSAWFLGPIKKQSLDWFLVLTCQCMSVDVQLPFIIHQDISIGHWSG